jgi:hypothetical protein
MGHAFSPHFIVCEHLKQKKKASGAECLETNIYVIHLYQQELYCIAWKSYKKKILPAN